MEANDNPELKLRPSVDTGLSSEQVRQQTEKGLYNKDSNLPTKSVKRIFADNILTLFNLINIVLALALLLVGSYKNMTFMLVILANIAIGIFQEIRAKIAVDKLSIINQNKVRVLRDGKLCEIPTNEIVLEDVLELTAGCQIPTDCIVLSGELEVNEALLTGESEPIHKAVGDSLLSGSFIISGKCRCTACHVGDSNYASTLFNGAKYVKK